MPLKAFYKDNVPFSNIVPLNSGDTTVDKTCDCYKCCLSGDWVELQPLLCPAALPDRHRQSGHTRLSSDGTHCASL